MLGSAAGALTTATLVLANVPDPGQGEAPPGMEGFVQLLSWTKWVALGICVLGLMVAGAHGRQRPARRGRGGPRPHRHGARGGGRHLGRYFVVGALA
ncbi:hypothetical protein [Georgenia sp. SUBG003]|uniref:hypothetical protein n=1 Tax=Georgenia sp. SUBG003 TaxID=1497974 RepID=UPI003AB40A3D